MVLLFTPLLLSAQFIPKEKPEKESFQSRFFWESSFGLQIGRVTNINLSPTVGIKLSKNLYFGVGASYTYYRNNYYIPAIDDHIFGGNAFLRYQLFRGFLLQGEYQLINYTGLDFTGQTNRRTVPGYLLGVGYRQWFNDKMYGDIFLLWNFNNATHYPYSNPIIRITFGGFF